MTIGTLYGIGVGPGDPELITVKGALLLAATRSVFVPKPNQDGDSLALSIARRYLRSDAEVTELIFPMATESAVLSERWTESAHRVAATLRKGEHACFLTLGDPMLYSTWIYLCRALGRVLPQAQTVTVPGITAVAAAAALTGVALGEGKSSLTIVPTAEQLGLVRQALATGGTVALMKVGKRLPEVIEAIAAHGALDRAVLVARAGLEGQRVQTDLGALRDQGPEAGYLSVVLIPPQKESS
jgi:precorrin-2/cobalt-factor-2 C20-methyltransferase